LNTSTDEWGTKTIPNIFRHPEDKSRQYADSECPFCYIEEQHRELKRLREAATEYARCVSEKIPRTSIAYELAARNLRAALEKADE